jgi:hypothetical protein
MIVCTRVSSLLSLLRLIFVMGWRGHHLGGITACFPIVDTNGRRVIIIPTIRLRGFVDRNHGILSKSNVLGFSTARHQGLDDRRLG